MMYEIKITYSPLADETIQYCAQAFLDGRNIEVVHGKTLEGAESELLQKLKAAESEKVVKQYEINIDAEIS
jgi:hypothetical protein